MRRYNGYYRDMEEWRKSERSKLKREGRYDREAIEYIYESALDNFEPSE